MTVTCFTSISLNYLAKARVLAWSLRRHHPDWRLIACITDQPPAGFKLDLNAEHFDEIIWAHDLDIEPVAGWLFKHDVVEVCTAVKGPLLKKLIDNGSAKVLYLDPDTAVFGSLQPIVDWLDEYSILLTPHILEPDNTIEAIFDNEICALAHGIYNLGFVAVRNDASGRSFAAWWDNRLRQFCYDDKSIGLFVDQKWCDHVPGLFDGVKVVRDPGYNVASWNLSQRKISIAKDGEILVNGSLLRFYHFTKLGPIGDTMTSRYAKNNTEVYELWSWYKHKVKTFLAPEIPSGYWHYSHFDNGVKIQKDVRVLYRHRGDLQDAFPNPFAAANSSYFNWLKAENLL
jgi:hypothetical protein